MKATKSYREIHPECNFLLLSADSAIRKIAGIEKANLREFEETPNNMVQQASNDTESHRKHPQQKKKETSYPWLWIIGTATLTAYLGSEYWKGKAEIVK